MNVGGGEAADQMVRMMLSGTEVMVRLSGMEAEYARYMDAVAVLEGCSIPKERLTAEKAEIYEQVAEVNRQIRGLRKKLALCRDILDRLPQIERDINKIEEHSKEVERDERRRR